MTYQPPRALASRPSEQIVRAVLASLLGQANLGAHAEKALAMRYPGDQGSAIILRAATSPASMTAPEWAALAGSVAVADFIGGLGPMSAAARLIGSSLQVDLRRNSALLVPGMLPTATAARLVAEGSPIPVTQLVISGPTLRPFKIAAIAVATRETLRATAAEAIIGQVLRESVALALDAAMLGTAAAVAGERPAGLRHGATSLTATAGGGDDAMDADLIALASAVTPVGGSAITYIASPDLALRLALRRPEMPYPVAASAALPAKTIMAIATGTLVTAIDPVADIDATTEAVIHMDSAPVDIGTAGSPPTTAAPSRSLWQSDCAASRVTLSVSWGLRTTSGAVAVISGTSW